MKHQKPYSFIAVVIAMTAALLTLFLQPVFAEALTVSSRDLIENAKAYTEQTIQYEGEIVGDILWRGDHAWVNLSDGSNAIGVWLTRDQLPATVTPGRYQMKGDTLQVVGEFHRACAEHGGDYDIHASQVTLTLPGHPVPQTLKPIRMGVGLGLFCILIGGGILTIYRLRFKERRL